MCVQFHNLSLTRHIDLFEVGEWLNSLSSDSFNSNAYSEEIE